MNSEKLANLPFLGWKQRDAVMAPKLQCNLLVEKLSMLSLGDWQPDGGLDFLLHLFIVACTVSVELKDHVNLTTIWEAAAPNSCNAADGGYKIC